jgi:SPP1 gp7 family putative phage head morphogenesis protein
MDDLQYQKALQEALAPKFQGRTEVVSKVVPQYPHSVEREYKRFVNEYMAMFDKILRGYMPELKRALGYYGPARFDEVPRTPDEIMAAAQREIEQKLLSYEPSKRLERMANMTRKLKVAEWNRVIQRTLGINIFEDYYNGDFFAKEVQKWAGDNVNLITTQPKDTLARMREIVQQGQADGRRVEAIAQDINEAYGTGQRHARLIARDQTAKLNSAITRKQQQDAGVRMYAWDTSGDQRVRESHRKMNGLYCRYDDVTVYSDDGGKTWKKKTLALPNIKGNYVHPGEDFQCRCIAMPVFNMAGVSEIPVASVDWKAVDARGAETIAVGKMLKAQGATFWEAREVVDTPGVTRSNAGQILAQQKQRRSKGGSA